MIEIARYIVSGLLLALVQTFILQEVNIAWWIKPMPYILLFLNIPVSVNKFGMLIGAFFFGMTIEHNARGLQGVAMVLYLCILADILAPSGIFYL